MSERWKDDTCWVEKKDEETYRVGILKEATEEADEFVFVQLPEAGKNLSRGDVCVTLESSKSTSEIESPVSGKVVGKNDDVFMNPAKINEYSDKAWLFEIKISNNSELDDLEKM